jgi:hypothetical protein
MQDRLIQSFLQVVSLTTATLSLIGSPLYILATMDGQYTAVKVMAASGFTCFGLFTTGAVVAWRVGGFMFVWAAAPLPVSRSAAQQS